MSCNSLELGLRRMKEASVDAMKVMERITATTQLEPQRDLCIEGNDESSTLSFSLDGCFVNSPKDATTSSLSFSSLAIIVPSKSTHHLNLSQSTLEEGLIVVNENGEVKLDSNTVSSLSTVQSSLIQLTGDQAVGINLTLTDQNGENHQNRGIIQLPCQHPFSPKPCTHEMDEHREDCLN
ncbi:hypothetical protein BLNAU_21024 [Blattamonas nauphoetae]|uniref:Uncharacterized protein n=1 Tax=Blattamonas nauphoetae TaxID=2049346 RepID=A0ABQ9WX12_9EUKA|nr:hypothetical protein BLNAU_21024 [Blattamonas nauphoetae]